MDNDETPGADPSITESLYSKLELPALEGELSAACSLLGGLIKTLMDRAVLSADEVEDTVDSVSKALTEEYALLLSKHPEKPYIAKTRDAALASLDNCRPSKNGLL